MAIEVLAVENHNNQRITGVGTPTSGTDAANKDYVDAIARGLDWKASVRVASTGTLNLASPGSAIDGVTMATNDRFLAKDQSTGSQNGIYVWNGAASAATRAVDADSDAEVTAGMATTVTEGTVNADRVYVLTTNDPIVVGTTALAFTQVGGGGGTYVAGNGLTETPAGTFNVGAGTGITVNANDITIDVAVVTRKLAFNVGDGSATAISLTHSWGTRDVSVQVYRATSPWDVVYPEVTRPDVNTVTLTFAAAPTASQYRAVLQG